MPRPPTRPPSAWKSSPGPRMSPSSAPPKRNRRASTTRRGCLANSTRSTARCRNNRMNAINFRDVRLNLGGRPILAGVTLDIADREFVGVLGPNGAGKTTLMRAVLGLLPPSQGAIEVLGRPVARGNPAVGYLPQERGAMAGMRLTGWGFVGAAVNGHCLGLTIP